MKKNYEKLIVELVEIEMDEMCHNDYPEDYDSKLSFYLSNAERESYLDYIKDRYEGITFDDAVEIQEEVIAEIERRYEAIQLAASMAGRKGGKSKSAAKARASRENGKLGGRPRIYGKILGSKDVIEAKGYVLTQTAAGKLVRSEPFKERVYSINGVDCIEMDSQSTASGSILHFFALEDIERNEQGWYIKPLRQARYLWKSWLKNKPEIPMRDYSVSENEKPYQK